MSANDDRDRYGDLEPIAQVLSEMVRRGKVHIIDDAAVRQRLQIEVAGRRFVGDQPRAESAVEYVQPYGFKSVPRAPDAAGSAECVCLLVAGDPDHPLVVAVTDVRDRPTGWAPGDVGLYDHRGNYVRCQAGKIVVEGATDIEIGTGATLGAARTTDATTWNADVQAWAGQVNTMLGVFQAALGGIGVLPTPPAGGYKGTITGGSTTVTIKD